MNGLTLLSKDKLRKIHREISDFFYKSGRNIAIDKALDADEYKKFEKNVESALDKQISFFDEDKIDEVLSRTQKADLQTELAIATAGFIVFTDALSGGQKTLLLYLLWASNRGGSDALNKMNASDITFNAKSDALLGKIDNRLSFAVDQVDKTTLAWLGSIISENAKEGYIAREISQIIKNNKNEYIRKRAGLIAETELITMFNISQLETFKKNGAKQKAWITTPDERTCQVCLGNESDGYIDIDAAFSSGNVAPQAHIRCRCYLMTKESVSGSVWRG